MHAACLGVLLMETGCSAFGHHHAGMNAMQDGDYVTAEAQLRQASEQSPQDVQYRRDWLANRETAIARLLGQGEAATRNGDHASAEQAYRSVLEIEQGNQRAKAGLDRLDALKQANEDLGQARLAHTHRDDDRAQQLLARALAANPDSQDAQSLKHELDEAQAKDALAAPSLGNLYKKPVNLEFRDQSVKFIFEALTRTTGINFILDRDVRADQRTTLYLRQTTLEDAIDVILATNQLDKKILNATSVLIYPNGGAKAKEYQDLLVRAFYLANADAKKTADLLKTTLKLKDVFIDERLNMLVLREPAATIALAEKLIDLHDLDQPEVMLDVEVLEINRQRLMQLGIAPTDRLTVTPLATTNFTLNDLKGLNGTNLGITVPSATITAHAENSDAKLLANPRLRVQHHEKAKFMIGDKVPIITTTNTSNGFSSENVQYQDVGLKVEVEADVHVHDEVGLKMSLEVSTIGDSVISKNGTEAFRIGSRNLSTALRLKDGETQIMAGLINDEDRTTANGLPFLSDLPMLGKLFSANKDTKNRNEIVLSITPHLIRGVLRQKPGAESFWSGSENNLRTKPLMLRNVEPAADAAGSAASAALGIDPRNAPTPATPVAGAPALSWAGPVRGKVGTPILLELRLESGDALRAAPLQISFNTAEFALVSVKEGDFFTRQGKSNFSYVLDAASGRISIGLTASEGNGKGEGSLAGLQLIPLRATADGQISVMAITPIGASKAVPSPALPVTHHLAIEQ